MFWKNSCKWTTYQNKIRLILYIRHRLAANPSGLPLAMSLKQINRKSNSELVKAITNLKDAARKNEAPLWRSVAIRLEGPSQNWPSVNISKLEYNADKNSKVVVPGKLLGAGTITKKVTVTAYSFTQSAVKKIEAAGGKCLSYNDFIKSNPKGTNVMVIG